MLQVEGIQAFSDNYIWLLTQSGGRHAVLVDPGEAEPVIKTLRERRLIPAAILVTHHHYDHTGGIRDLLNTWPMPVYGPAEERIPGRTHALRDADEVVLEELGARFQVLDVRGHTAGHIAYYGHGLLFCGDTLFAGGCGRLFEGTPAQMHASLEKIAALPDDTLVYCAHEYTQDNLNFAVVVEPDNLELRTRIGTVEQARKRGEATVPARLAEEKKTNPFLRCTLPQVTAAAEKFNGAELSQGAEVFAVVRHWKDTLD